MIEKLTVKLLFKSWNFCINSWLFVQIKSYYSKLISYKYQTLIYENFKFNYFITIHLSNFYFFFHFHSNNPSINTISIKTYHWKSNVHFIKQTFFLKNRLTHATDQSFIISATNLFARFAYHLKAPVYCLWCIVLVLSVISSHKWWAWKLIALWFLFIYQRGKLFILVIFFWKNSHIRRWLLS